MDSVLEQYQDIYKKTQELNQTIQTSKAALSSLAARRAGALPARIRRLEEQIEKIDDYMLRIEGFSHLAEKNLESRNVLTIEAPPGYRVNLNRLRNWAMMIDPSSSNDPYAQRVYVVAQCDLCFLNQKKTEFLKRIETLKQDEETGSSEERKQLEAAITECREELRKIAAGDLMNTWLDSVIRVNREYCFETPPDHYAASGQTAVKLAFGACAIPFMFEKEERIWLKGKLGDFYDEAGGHVMIPYEIGREGEFALTVLCAPARSRQLDSGLQNLIMKLIETSRPGCCQIHVLDAVRYSSASIGSLKQLENTFAMGRIPRNQEQLTAELEQIVSSFSDMDEVLGLHDSVIEYNAGVSEEKQLSRKLLILFGWPNAFQGRDRELVMRILTNYERYGISFVTVSYRTEDRKDAKEDGGLPLFAEQSAIHIRMLSRDTRIQSPNQPEQGFMWYFFPEELPESYAVSLREHKLKTTLIGNEYTSRYDVGEFPEYTRDYKKIELPFGIDGKDQVHSVSFENENFAAYLVGASRSGKSTLLHTLIAGLIRNFHPDNLELWLADFKQLEFKKYMEHCPPHVKYILLDESTELVFDLIDRLTEKMMERQRIFARLGKERIDQLNPAELKEPMPVIFVILDEFSIMSQAIAESQSYRLRLQNLLAKGAALGIRFLFSSQTFTTGIAGLTPTARAQIQQRIAMKGTRDEISATLELSANLKTEQVKNWMDALPPHYALIKFREGADVPPQVKRVLVMYFKDYAPRDAMIEQLNTRMRPMKSYHPEQLDCYVDKQPVLVDGNSYEAFSENRFHEYVGNLKNTGTEDCVEDEAVPVMVGSPRLMVREKAFFLAPEARENMILIGRSTEQCCSAAVLTAAMKSFLSMKKRVQIWAYEKDRLYRSYGRTAWAGEEYCQVTVAEGMEAVCTAIHELKEKIKNRQTSQELIVLIGMERLCADFEFFDDAGERFAEPKKSREQNQENLKNQGAIVTTDEDAMAQKRAMEWLQVKKEVRRKAREAGRSSEETARMIETAKEEFFGPVQQEGAGAQKAPAAQPLQQPLQEESSMADKKMTAETGAYNAKEDFIYVVRQGSRLGYHFALYLTSLADLKQTFLKLDLFRHRMAFQVSAEDSRELFSNKNASTLPEHVCQYSDALERYSFRPYLHRNITWDGWDVDESGEAVNPFRL